MDVFVIIEILKNIIKFNQFINRSIKNYKNINRNEVVKLDAFLIPATIFSLQPKLQPLKNARN